MTVRRRPLMDRLMAKVTQSGVDGCWIFNGSRNPEGDTGASRKGAMQVGSC